MTIADLRLDATDEMGEKVLTVYGYKPPAYAVYATQTRVTILYADDRDEQTRQRKSMARLNPVRGEINGLIDGWRYAKFPKSMSRKARRYDRRVADALVLALEEDLDSADTILSAVKQDIIDERTGWARLEYLGCALLLSLIAIAIADGCATTITADLWRAAAAGAVGAFFSIALAIRTRTVLTDLHRTSNNMDAALRITIGVIAAVVLLALVDTQAVKLTFGDDQKNQPWLPVLLIGFIAGFSERLVPDLLAKAASKVEAPPDPAAKPLKPDAGPTPEARKLAVNAPLLPDNDESTAPPTYEGHVDNCLCDGNVPDGEATPDDQLPVASGGVEASTPTTGGAR